RMTTEEAVWSATAGGARALCRDDIGRLTPGARADLILLDAPSHAYLAYRPVLLAAAGRGAGGLGGVLRAPAGLRGDRPARRRAGDAGEGAVTRLRAAGEA